MATPLTPEQIATIVASKKARKHGARRDSATGQTLQPCETLPRCNHVWQPDATISGRGKEFPTKRCMECNVRIIVPVGEVVEEGDIAEWLTGGG